MSGGIVPRWEWRTFGDDFGAAESVFAAETAERVQESDELYLVSRADGDTVKIRDGLMDLKQLQRVEHGLEQWLPVMKAEFPLHRDDVSAVLTALRLAAPPAERDGWTLAELRDEVARLDPSALAVEVHKRRVRYTIGGCTSELTEVSANGRATRTIAVESEDPERVLAAVRELGLGDRPNVNYPRGLKELLRFGASRFAVVDVGTNSVKFHIGERSDDGAWRTVVDRAEITRLGQGLDDTGRLAEEPIGRTIDAVAGMVAEAARERVRSAAAVGTAALRIAANATEFLDALRERCGLVVEVLSPEDEARLAYLAATSGLPQAGGRLVVFDTGGGSTQFTFGRSAQEIEERFSLEVGAVRYTERFGLATAEPEDVVDEALGAIAEDLASLASRPRPDAVIGMGGALTNMAAVSHGLTTYDPDVVQGSTLDVAEIDRQIRLYAASGGEDRRAIAGLQPGRADVLLAGACIVRTVLKELGAASLTISDRGLRHGVLVERFGQPPS